jgi:PAS domain S-box-containing protein
VLVQDTLEAEGVVCRITRVETEAAFVAALARDDFDLILADYTLPSFDGLFALKLATQSRPHTPFIFVSGTLGEEVAIDALKIGATDYVFKTRLSRILPSVQRALREAAERAERNRAEEALRQSEAFLAEAQRLSQTGSFSWDMSSGDMYWSRETFRIFGCNPADAVTPEVMVERTHPDDRPAIETMFDRAPRDSTVWDCEHRLLLPDGTVKHVHVIARRLTDGSGWRRCIGAIQDVTRRRRAEEGLRNSQAELARATRLTTMGELTASIAHEINQPLTAVVSNGNAGLRWLIRDVPDLAEAQSAFERIVANATRAGDVIRGIRALAMKSESQLCRLDIAELTNEVLALTRSELQRHDVLLHTGLALSPPVLGDRVQLQQVLLNLIVNSVDAMKAVSDRPRELTVSSAVVESTGVLVSVDDTGTGLDPATASRIFDPFFSTKSDSLGMGLSICKSIIEAHGGQLWAAPRAPHGTALRFTVPLAPA